MTTETDLAIQDALLEGARDRLRSLGRSDVSEALLVVYSLRESVIAASLIRLLPLLDRVANELTEGQPGAVERVLAALQAYLDGAAEPAEEPDEFQQCFMEEASGHLDEIRDRLARLDEELGDRAALGELRRTVHTLKGAAAMVGREETSSAAHLLEELFDELHEGARTLDQTLLRRLVQAADLLERLVHRPDQAKELEVALLVLLGDKGTSDADDRISDVPSGPGRRRRQRTTERRDTSASLRLPLAQLRRLDRFVDGTCRECAGIDWELGQLQGAGTKLRDLTTALLDVAESDRSDAARVLADLARGLSEATARVESSADRLARKATAVTRSAGQSQQLLGELQAISASWIFDRLVAAADEVGYRRERQLAVERHGDDLAIDRRLAGWVLDPLLHLVRNAVAHGIEEPAQRTARGKEPSGRLQLEARAESGWIVFTVKDDGRGIDFEKIRQRVVAMGMCSNIEAEQAGAEQLLDWVFLPGVSTSARADEVAGRGVGLDAVRAEVAGHNGTVRVETQPGRGTRFDVWLPDLSEASRVLLFNIGDVRFGLRLAAVERVVPAGGGDGRARQAGFARSLGLRLRRGGGHWAIVLVPDPGQPPASDRRILEVDSVAGVFEARLDPLAGRLAAWGPYAGVGVLDGDPLPVLMVEPTAVCQSRVETHQERQILLAEDSLTARAVLAKALTAVGFGVTEATDGVEAWELLQSGGPFEVLVTDLDMPRRDGLALIERVRRDAELAAMPVVVVTSKSTAEARRRAAELGVSAVVSKRDGDTLLVPAVQDALAGSDDI